jgi:hypothetical protein
MFDFHLESRLTTVSELTAIHIPVFHSSRSLNIILIYVSVLAFETLSCDELLTYCMVLSSSWAENWFTASQKIPRISRNPKVHYRTHKRPPPFLILGQPNPVHIPTSHILEIHPNIIHTSTPRSTHWSFALRFPHYLQLDITFPLYIWISHLNLSTYLGIKLFFSHAAWTLTKSS